MPNKNLAESLAYGENAAAVLNFAAVALSALVTTFVAVALFLQTTPGAY
jgi:hypothetical protein